MTSTIQVEEVLENISKLDLADDGYGESGDGEKKKKKKEEKTKGKVKKSKLEKKLEAAKAQMEEEKKENGGIQNESCDDEDVDEEANEKARRKAEKAAKKASKAENEAKKSLKLQKEEDDVGSNEGMDEEGNNSKVGGDEDEVFYGAPDDHAWTDASHAIKEAENNKDDGPDTTVSPCYCYQPSQLTCMFFSCCVDSYSQLIYDKNGKKLSNKKRKKLIKTREAEARAAEYEIQVAKASMEGAQFACSQTAVNEGEAHFFSSFISLSFDCSPTNK